MFGMCFALCSIKDYCRTGLARSRTLLLKGESKEVEKFCYSDNYISPRVIISDEMSLHVHIRMDVYTCACQDTTGSVDIFKLEVSLMSAR